MAEAGGPESTAARCPDESSDSEPEQEPGTPQKLIRKVSTSGQIRSKVRGSDPARLEPLSLVSGCFHSAGVGHTQTWLHRSVRGSDRPTELPPRMSNVNGLL